MHYSSMAMTDSELSSDHFTPWSASPYHLEQQENQKKHGNKKKTIFGDSWLSFPHPQDFFNMFFFCFSFFLFSPWNHPQRVSKHLITHSMRKWNSALNQHTLQDSFMGAGFLEKCQQTCEAPLKEHRITSIKKLSQSMQYSFESTIQNLEKSCSAKVYGRYIKNNMCSWSIKWYMVY